MMSSKGCYAHKYICYSLNVLHKATDSPEKQAAPSIRAFATPFFMGGTQKIVVKYLGRREPTLPGI